MRQIPQKTKPVILPNHLPTISNISQHLRSSSSNRQASRLASDRSLRNTSALRDTRSDELLSRERDYPGAPVFSKLRAWTVAISVTRVNALGMKTSDSARIRRSILPDPYGFAYQHGWRQKLPSQLTDRMVYARDPPTGLHLSLRNRKPDKSPI